MSVVNQNLGGNTNSEGKAKPTIPNEYQWDTIESYRLNTEIIDGYLQGLFGFYDYYTRLATDKYQFWVPRKLTQAERDSLIKLRTKDTKKK